MIGRRRVDAYWWRRPGGLANFGDDLNDWILTSTFSIDVRLVPIHEADLIAIGSILQQVRPRDGSRLHCWGSGLIRRSAPVAWESLDVRAVRGKLTRELVPNGRGVALGDPGLLVSSLVPPPRAVKRFRLGVVPHYVDSASLWVDEAARSDEITVLDVEDDPRAFVERVGECEAVVSSSLHGLIVADALRVPNAWIRLSDGVAGEGFKFADYYSAFDREARPWALRSAATLARDVVRSYREVDELESIQQRLLDSFPVEVVQ